jgi:hypothetical protein
VRLLEVYLIIFRLDYIFIDSVLNLSESKFENELDSYREVAIEREKWILTLLSRIKSIFCITVKPSIDFNSHYQPYDADKEYTHYQYGLEKRFEKVTVWEQGISFITEVEADEEEDNEPQDLNREEQAGSVDRSPYSIMRDIVEQRDQTQAEYPCPQVLGLPVQSDLPGHEEGADKRCHYQKLFSRAEAISKFLPVDFKRCVLAACQNWKVSILTMEFLVLNDV